MDTRYIDAEHKLALTLDWTETNYSGPAANATARAQGRAPGGGSRGDVPAWARSNDACVKLMLAHGCFVAKEATSSGADVMVARWKNLDGFAERIAVPTSEHTNEASAFRYAAVLGVTSKVEEESRARELRSMVNA